MRTYSRQIVKTLLERTLFGIKFVGANDTHANVKLILLVNFMVLGALAKMPKATISFVISVCPFRNRLPLHGFS